MKRRPWPIVILAVLHALTPFGNFYLTTYHPDISYLTYFSAFVYAPNIWSSFCFLVLPVVAGVTIYLCKRWSIWAYLFMMSIILVQSYVNSHAASSASLPIPPFILFFTNIFVVIYFLVPAVRQVYFDPRLRWWESKPRYIVDFDAEIKSARATTLAKIKNISESGLFAIIGDNYPTDGSLLEVRFKDGDQEYVVAGTAIHHMQQPKVGMGIKFDTTLDSKRNLKSLTKKLEAEGKRLPSRKLGPEDSLISWLKSLRKNPRNLFPNVPKKN
ncbi:MAG: hypothetical protein A4S09_03535 [Proteobacteria bacterium SG_bin7]|nr:MAG: hypothetical protein A4S09_03535 [Proteobacteria bacterium SG_bin7]